ncbi:MAG: glyoxylase-like metal-dependent hydrolase (beta-lactamase superfamily II) [Sphingomonas echinoides]|jgi:glyoxylase-like metal-dependent hydrolase (beta-lactamase superfamily II)|uniref:MBL fold metallo-hydrolase n=3 Tax=Pseudomonadota TaxID=1224 RepID=UPI002FF01454
MKIFQSPAKRRTALRVYLAGAAIAAWLTSAMAMASPYSDINAAAKGGPVSVTRLRGNISMLAGSGGNITAFASPSGFFLVDTGIAVSRNMIQAALKSIHPGPIKLAIDTHWHWDHADGNGWVRASGASILADRKAIQRLKQTIRVVEWEHTFTPIGKQALPDVVLTGDRDLSLNGETVRIRHYGPGHTDGDLSVYFVKADILSVGDTFWNGQYPFIDYVTGGSINGAIAAANANIAMSGAHTIIVPGHGPVGDRASQIAFRDMLVAVRNKVARLKAEGKTLAQIQAAKPTAAYDAKWGRSVIKGSLFTALVYRGV